MKTARSQWSALAAITHFPLLVQRVAAEETKSTRMNGDEFSNNLFSDLAPLLALFGERVATQYLRHSTQNLENVIFACAPLGIITAVTAAIRVGGNRKLKALIGRAEEAEAQAEIELVSSTSADICELWNGVGLVRVVGKPQILEVVYDEELAKNEKGTDMYNCTYGLYTRGHGMKPDEREQEENPLDFEEISEFNIAPNISLNTIGGSIGKTELRLVALTGVVLQLGVLAFDGAVTFHWEWEKGERNVARYAFPLTVIGTLGVMMGMYLCAYVVEKSTKETSWVPSPEYESGGQRTPRVIWVQKSQTVGDQGFRSFAIYAPTETTRGQLMTSHRIRGARADAKLQKLTVVASGISVAAFVLQFVGLRAMHFSASIAQLVATVLMTILRVFIRRHISQPALNLTGNTDKPSDKTYSVRPLSEGYELDAIAMQLQKCDVWQVITYHPGRTRAQSLTNRSNARASISSQPSMGSQQFPKPQVSTSSQTSRSSGAKARKQTPDVPGGTQAVTIKHTVAERVIGSRMRLASLLTSPWNTELREHAMALSATIAGITNLIWAAAEAGELVELNEEAGKASELSWQIPVRTKAFDESTPCVESLSLHATRYPVDGQWTSWMVDSWKIEALLQLWMLQLKGNVNVPEDHRVYSIWLLCPHNDNMATILADWWIGRESHIVKNKSINEICREYGVMKEDGTPDVSRIISYSDAHLTSQPSATAHARTYATPPPQNIYDVPMSRVIVQYTTLANMCAQYILYAYLWELMRDVTRLIPETTVVPDLHGNGTILLSNNTVRHLAAEAQKGGFLTIDEAYSIVVCALYGNGMLSLPENLHDTAMAFARSHDYGRTGADRDDGLARLDLFSEGAAECCILEIEALLAKDWEHWWKKAAEMILWRATQYPDHKYLERLRKCMAELGQRIVISPPPSSPGSTFVYELGTALSTMHSSAAILYNPDSPNVHQPQSPATTVATVVPDSGLPLEGYARHKYLSDTCRLIHHDINALYTPDSGGKTFLHHAAYHGREDIVLLLSLCSASQTPAVDTFRNYAQAALWSALEGLLTHEIGCRASIGYVYNPGSYISVITTLVIQDVNPSVLHPKSGRAPLHWAAVHCARHLKVLDALTTTACRNEIVIDVPDRDGWTPLHYAIKQRQLGAVRGLLARGANVRAANSINGMTALHLEVLSMPPIVEIMQMLIEAGADLEAEDSQAGRTPLYMAAQCGEEIAIDVLLQSGADVNAVNTRSGLSVLEVAIRSGNGIVVQKLLQNGAIIFTQDYRMSRTALHFTALGGHWDVLWELFNWSASILAIIDSTDRLGSTPLHCAVSARESGIDTGAIVGYLLDQGASVELEDIYGRTPLLCAAESGNLEAVSLLLGRNANAMKTDTAARTALHLGVRHKKITKLLLCVHPGGIHSTDRNLRTPLHYAVLGGFDEIVSSLLGYGADLQAKDKLGKTALDLASEAKHETIVMILTGRHQPVYLRDNPPASSGYIDQGLKSHTRANMNVSPTLGLHQAAKYGYRGMVWDFLSQTPEVDINKYDIVGMTALHYAANTGHIQTVELLLGRGANVQARDEFGSGVTALHHAATQGHKGAVDVLVTSGAVIDDLGAVGIRNMTPLQCAVKEGHRDVVATLLKNGANVKIPDGLATGMTALHYAAAAGHDELVQDLLAAGADIEAQDYNGKTALYYAARNGQLEVVYILFSNGANLDTAEMNGANAWMPTSQDPAQRIRQLMLAIQLQRPESCAVEQPKIQLHFEAKAGNALAVQRLLEEGADTDIEDDGKRALHYAAKEGHLAVVDILLRKGVNIEARDPEGKTALHYAAEEAHDVVATALVMHGAEIHARSIHGKTPLHYAAISMHKKRSLIDMLLCEGAEADARDNKGLTALHWAAKVGQTSAVLSLLDAVFAIDARDDDGKTPLHWAAKYCRSEVVQILLRRGSSITVTDNSGRTALHSAMRWCDLETIRALLDNMELDLVGVCLNAKDAGGRTVLHHAVRTNRDNIRVLQNLIVNGANVNAVDNLGKTPLHMAAEEEYAKGVKLLLDSGAEIELEDHFGRTALDFAQMKNSEEVTQILRLCSGALGNKGKSRAFYVLK